MVRQDVTIVNEGGLYMMPCAMLREIGVQYISNVMLRYDGVLYSGKSVMNMMSAGIRKGAVVTVECSGPDEEEALDAVLDAISSGFSDRDFLAPEY